MSSLKRVLLGKNYVLIRTTRTDHISIPPAVEDALNETPREIVWNNDGVYAIIDEKQVKNDVRLRSDRRGASMRLTPLKYRWNEVAIPMKSSTSVTYLTGSAKAED